jgi:hypothetical protein
MAAAGERRLDFTAGAGIVRGKPGTDVLVREVAFEDWNSVG